MTAPVRHVSDYRVGEAWITTDGRGREHVHRSQYEAERRVSQWDEQHGEVKA